MRILHVSTQKPFATGSGTFVTGLITALAEAGHRQALVCGLEKDEPFGEQLEGPFAPSGLSLYAVRWSTEALPLHVLGMSDIMPYPSTRYDELSPKQEEAVLAAYTRVLRRAVEEFKPELILCQHLFLITALVRRLFPELPVYAFCHQTGLRQADKLPAMKQTIAPDLAALDGVFALHPKQRESILEHYALPPERCHVTGSACDLSLFNRSRILPDPFKGAPRRGLRLIYAGKISRLKGVDLLLRAAALLPPEDFELVLIGDSTDPGESRLMESLMAACPLPLHRFPKQDHTALPAFYRQADLFLLPSLREGLPLGVPEALACGLPVVMSRIEGAAEGLETLIGPSEALHFTSFPPAVRHCPELMLEQDEQAETFVRQLAEDILFMAQKIRQNHMVLPDISGCSWTALASRVMNLTRRQPNPL